MGSLLKLDNLPLGDIEWMLSHAMGTKNYSPSSNQKMKGKHLAPLFFQESSRTYMNSTTAFMRLGGTLLPMNIENTRLNETWSEPIRDFCVLLNNCCDYAVIRSADVGVVEEFASWLDIPIINAGNGYGKGSEHPVQALNDITTIRSAFGKRAVKVLMIGGKHVRTMRTLVKLLLRMGHTVDLIVSDKQLDIDNSDMDDIYDSHVNYHSDLQSCDLSQYDVIYHTGADEDQSVENDKRFIINRKLLEESNFKGKVMHGLPRLSELTFDVDDTSHNLYFEQMRRLPEMYTAVFHYISGEKKVSALNSKRSNVALV